MVEGTGMELDHRILRRTWEQMLLGHASTATTNRYYARTRERSAIAAVRRVWETTSQTGSEEE